MKFGKTFESYLTTEWRQQYMNYAVNIYKQIQLNLHQTEAGNNLNSRN